MKKDLSQKRILILGINFAPELTGIGKYTGEMVDWLVENGYQCTVVTSFPYYPNWKIQSPYKGKFYKKEVLKKGNLHVYRCPLYVPSVPSGGKRILHDASFFISAFLMIFYLLFKQKNNRIFCIAPPFHLGFLALIYRFFKGGKIIYHVHDLQIEAARDLKVLKSERLFGFLFRLEKFIIKRSDYISTISAGMIRRIAAKTTRHIILFPNWVDITLLSPLDDRDNLKKLWGFGTDDKVVVYSGSIGEKQGLESLISIAKSLKSINYIKFVICGSGPYKEKLRQLSEENDLDNVTFLPLQPLPLFNEFLNMADLHLVLQKKNACDLMMPSKLTGILASGGLALVTAEPGSTLYSVINEHKMGVVIGCEDEELLKTTIVKCCSDDFSKLSLNGRKYAERFLDKENILRNIVNEITLPRINPMPTVPAFERLDLKNA